MLQGPKQYLENKEDGVCMHAGQKPCFGLLGHAVICLILILPLLSLNCVFACTSPVRFPGEPVPITAISQLLPHSLVHPAHRTAPSFPSPCPEIGPAWRQLISA